MSPWPIVFRRGIFGVIAYTASWCWGGNLRAGLFLFGLVFMFLWLRDVYKEGLTGENTGIVIRSIKNRFILFLLREVMFFFGFFWGFFHYTLVDQWPPIGVVTCNPWGIPLLNTLLLLTSGIRVTVAHHLLSMHKHWKTWLLLTLLCGFSFLGVQTFEYFELRYSLADSVFGSIFFVTTGFHGFHVLVGRRILLSWLMRSSSSLDRVHVNVTIWYWHFVDVVWIILYMFYYVYV